MSDRQFSEAEIVEWVRRGVGEVRDWVGHLEGHVEAAEWEELLLCLKSGSNALDAIGSVVWRELIDRATRDRLLAMEVEQRTGLPVAEKVLENESGILFRIDKDAMVVPDDLTGLEGGERGDGDNGS